MEESFLTNGIFIINTKGKAELRARMARYHFFTHGYSVRVKIGTLKDTSYNVNTLEHTCTTLVRNI